MTDITQAQLPPLPEPADTALVEGVAMRGSEYRTLSRDYEEWTARYSVRQMREYAADAIRSYAERLAQVQQVPQWMPIETAPKDGTPFLAWYAKHQLDENDETTDEVIGGACAVVACNGRVWEEPDWLSAHGSYYMEDWCFADMPAYWMPIPAAPAYPGEAAQTPDQQEQPNA